MNEKNVEEIGGKHFNVVGTEASAETAVKLCEELEEKGFRPVAKQVDGKYQVMTRFTRAEEIEWLLDRRCGACAVKGCTNCSLRSYRENLRFHEENNHSLYLMRLLEMLSSGAGEA